MMRVTMSVLPVDETRVRAYLRYVHHNFAHAEPVDRRTLLEELAALADRDRVDLEPLLTREAPDLLGALRPAAGRDGSF